MLPPDCNGSARHRFSITDIDHRAPPHVTHMRARLEWRRAVQRAAIIPDDQIAQPPLMGIDETWLRRMCQEVAEEGTALLDRPADDVRGVRGDIERLSPRARMASHQWMTCRWPCFDLVFGRRVAAELRARVPDRVLGNQPFECCLGGLRQRVISGAGVGELSIG